MRRKSRQIVRPASKSVQISRNRSLSVNAKNLPQNTFMKKFQGKINIVTREIGLRGVLMKSIDPKFFKKPRYLDQSTAMCSRVKTEISQPVSQFNSIPNSAQSQQLSDKQNIRSHNIRIVRNSQPFQMKTIEQKGVTPFHLPRLTKIKLKRQYKIINPDKSGNQNVKNKVQKEHINIKQEIKKIR